MTSDFQPLHGLRVVEMTHMIMGPSAGMFLGLLGAEVIKVEPPEGDKTRHLTGMGRGFFPTFNRGKKSVTLDTGSEAGRAALHRLLATADVFVENFRDGSLAAMGLAPDALRARYPGLIVSSLKGFLSGPYQDRTAMDEVVQMMTGMAYMTGPTGRPLRIGSSANDIMGGLFGAFAVLAALINRPAQMYDDPHVNRPGGLWTSRLPDGQTYRAPSLPVEADGRGVGGARVDIPALGADTQDVLGALGLTPEEIAAARGRKGETA